jgi:hypothetical protein
MNDAAIIVRCDLHTLQKHKEEDKRIVHDAQRHTDTNLYRDGIRSVESCIIEFQRCVSQNQRVWDPKDRSYRDDSRMLHQYPRLLQRFNSY